MRLQLFRQGVVTQALEGAVGFSSHVSAVLQGDIQAEGGIGLACSFSLCVCVHKHINTHVAA